jgi:transcriptional regulator with XRE-family HTH domain
MQPAGPRPSLRLRSDVLRLELAVRGIDQRELAQAAGVSEATVSHAANGHAVNPQTLRRIAAALASLPRLPGAAELAEVRESEPVSRPADNVRVAT